MNAFITILALALFVSPVSAGGGSSGGVGTTPHTSPGGDTIIETVAPETMKPAKLKVKPGEEATNGDGVTVTNDEDSKGDATLSPVNASGPNPETKVKTTTGFEGSVAGIDGNDSLNFSSSNTVTVTGDGGWLTLGGGSTATITNGTAGGNMYVSLPSGNTMTIAPGSTVTITT